jgi:signal transduction histidine kinase
VRSAEESAGAEVYYIARSFERDLEDLLASGEGQSPSLLMNSYGNYYDDRGVFLSFELDGKTVFSSLPEKINAESGTLFHKKMGGVRHIIICSEVGGYKMTFAKNVESLDREFRALTLTFVLTSLGMSAFLAAMLYFVLRKLSRPLEDLQKTTECIEAGNLSILADESGKDEFALLAKSFNSMIGTVKAQMAALEENAERKQMLVDNMAHELRTPLTVIRGYAEYLERAEVGEEERALAANYIVSEAERLTKMSEILLDTAYIRENPPEMSLLSLDKVLHSTAQRLASKAKEKKIEIICETEEVTLNGNVLLLSMLFDNLVDNAVKACEEGGRVILRCLPTSASVEDNGKGMSEEELLRITEPFYRTDKSRSRAEGGAGLGLALCKNIAEAHGACLRFESKIGKGTKVFFDFTT